MEKLTEMLQTLIKHYGTLLCLSRTKTDRIIQNDTDSLTKILVRENALVQLITQLEGKRQQHVEILFGKSQRGEERTMRNLLKQMPEGAGRSTLQELCKELMASLLTLQEIEKRNASLLDQSLALVELSLEMVQPTRTKMNYSGDRLSAQIQKPSYSVFDTKA
jgi:flagellar biosynthesis/type III secretory pathway chaperone